MRYRFSVCLLLFIIGMIFLSYIILPENDISDIERRYLETFSRVIHPDPELAKQEDSNYVFHNQITQRVEAALEDQFPFRANFVAMKNSINTSFKDHFYLLGEQIDLLAENIGLKKLKDEQNDASYPVYGYARLEQIPEHSYPSKQIGSFYRLGDSDWLGNIIPPAMNGTAQRNVATLSGQLACAAKTYDIPLYCLLVTTSEDTGWFGDFQGGIDNEEFIAQNLPLSCKVVRTQLTGLADYEQCFFKTDHHMAYIGTERMYETIYNMLSEDLPLSPLYMPIATWNFTGEYGVQYRGSRAASVKGIASYSDVYDDFIVYEYDLPEHQTYIVDPTTGVETPIVNGRWDAYQAGDISTDPYYDHYIHFYGYDSTDTYSDASSIFIYDFSSVNPDGYNLLYLGDSYQRAIREVLCAHMKMTVWLDYRQFHKYQLAEVIKQYDINVILIGSSSFLWMNDGYTFKEYENGEN